MDFRIPIYLCCNPFTGIYSPQLGITVASVLGAVFINLLEVLVAFLQAYIFTFLTTLFVGMAIQSDH